MMPPKSAIHHFLFTLGPGFETIQNNYRIGNLPAGWHTNDWPSLLVLCRDYYNLIKPQGLTCREPTGNLTSTFDRAAHQKKVKEWFFEPLKYCKEIGEEQAKFAGKCLYHLTKSHQTCDCYLLKESDKPGKTDHSNKKQNGTTGQLRYVTEDVSEEVVDECLDDNSEDLGTILTKIVCTTLHV